MSEGSTSKAFDSMRTTSSICDLPNGVYGLGTLLVDDDLTRALSVKPNLAQTTQWDLWIWNTGKEKKDNHCIWV